MIYRKKITITVLLAGACLLPAVGTYGQTWDEWFEQKKTQINYLEKQIAGLQLYIADLEKGYQIAQKGLQVINNLKHGDFDLHSAYFTSLLNVNPAIGQHSTVADCRSLIAAITSQSQTLRSRLSSSPVLPEQEQDYIGLVLQSLQTRTVADQQDLNSLVGNGNLSLQDAERQYRIDSVHADLMVQYRFIQRFSAQVSILGVQLLQTQAEGATTKQFYGLP